MYVGLCSASLRSFLFQMKSSTQLLGGTGLVLYLGSSCGGVLVWWCGGVVVCWSWCVGGVVMGDGGR